MFEKILDEEYTDTLMQNILNLEHVIDDNEKSRTIALKKGSQLLGLFCDHKKKTCIFD